jgi:hypothetical protein
MNTHTHTPGPWRIDSKTRFGDYTIAAGESVKTCEFIAKTQSDTNARLIAAAPDLLAALIEMLDASERPVNERWLLNVRSHARAAISKAEGVK